MRLSCILLYQHFILVNYCIVKCEKNACKIEYCEVLRLTCYAPQLLHSIISPTLCSAQSLQFEMYSLSLFNFCDGGGHTEGC